MVSNITVEERNMANQHFDRGLSFGLRGKINEAIAEMEKVIAIDPGFAEAFNKLGDYYMKKGQVQRALEMFKHSIELKPEIENTHYDLGCAYAHLGQYSESLSSLQQALRMDPKHYEIYGRIGHVYLQMAMYNEAVHNLRVALTKDSEDLMAQFTLGVALIHLDKHAEARPQFTKVIERYSVLTKVKDRFAEGEYYLGRSHFYLGNYDQAVAHLKLAVEYDTDEIDYHFSFGMLYSDADAFFALAEALAAQQNFAEARKALTSALELEPDNGYFLELKQKIF